MSKYVQFHGARAKLRPSLTPCVSKTRRKSMKRLCAVVLFCTIAAPRVFGDAQDTVVFRAQMLPDNEIPAIAAAGNSAAAAIVVHVTRDDKGNINAATVTFNVDYKVTSALTFTGLHIHNAPAGLNGPVVIDSGISGSNTVSAVAGPGRITRVVNYASTDTNGLKFVTGLLTTPENYYVNIHTTVNPAGFMRAFGHGPREDAPRTADLTSPEIPAGNHAALPHHIFDPGWPITRLGNEGRFSPGSSCHD